MADGMTDREQRVRELMAKAGCEWRAEYQGLRDKWWFTVELSEHIIDEVFVPDVLVAALLASPPAATNEFTVRECRGHFHVCAGGEDMAIAGDPFVTREAAGRAACKLEAELRVPAAPTSGRGSETNFLLRAATATLVEGWIAVRQQIVGSRSPLGDALLELRDALKPEGAGTDWLPEGANVPLMGVVASPTTRPDPEITAEFANELRALRLLRNAVAMFREADDGQRFAARTELFVALECVDLIDQNPLSALCGATRPDPEYERTLLTPANDSESMAAWLDDLADSAEGEPGNFAWNLQHVARRLRSTPAATRPDLNECSTWLFYALREEPNFKHMNMVALSVSLGAKMEIWLRSRATPAATRPGVPSCPSCGMAPEASWVDAVVASATRPDQTAEDVQALKKFDAEREYMVRHFRALFEVTSRASGTDFVRAADVLAERLRSRSQEGE